MKSEQVILTLFDALESSGVAYMLTGSLASNLYGIPRSTKDADVVLEMFGPPVQQLAQALGPAFRLDPQLSFETVTGTHRHIIHVERSRFVIELFELGADAHDQARFHRRRRIQFESRELWAATPEDVIVGKLRWAVLASRSKDVDDATKVIATQRHKLDWPYIRSWCERHGSIAILDDIMRTLPDV